MSLPSYVLLSSVKNEAAHLEAVVASVCAQSHPPLRWYITDDGSSDDSLAILKEFVRYYPFISVLENPPWQGHNWASKDRTINANYELARTELGGKFDYVGIHDGDIAVEDDYFARFLTEAVKDERIGVLGGIVYEPRKGQWRPRSGNSLDSVPGSAFFSRKCFEAVGGYLPLEYGGSDWLIQIDARRAGFTIKVVPQCTLYHYRPTNSTTVAGSFKAGLMDASLGSDLLFEFLKCARRMLHFPFGLPGLLRLTGYLYYRSTRIPLIEPGKVSYLRSLQRAKLADKLL
jgi:glycosyltransferase involved in cell wall biosynthesis